jgi:hypothetical protein
MSLHNQIDKSLSDGSLELREKLNRIIDMKNPEIDNKIYVPSSYYVYRGEDDFHGGIATINKIEYNENLPDNHMNKIMIGIKENPRTMYNYKSLMESQDKLKKEFGDTKAFPDPDDRPEFNCPDSGWKTFNRLK